MTIFAVNVPATFSFDIEAETPGEARWKAQELLRSGSPVNDHGAFRSGYYAPFVSVGGEGHAETLHRFPGVKIIDPRPCSRSDPCAPMKGGPEEDGGPERSDRYVLVLTGQEWDTLGKVLHGHQTASGNLRGQVTFAPSGDVSMLLDAAEDGCEHIRSDYSLAGKPELRDEYRRVAGFIARIREHWKP